MAEDKQSKTEDPTAHRLNKAREEGQVAKSMELNTFAVLLIGVSSIYLFGSHIYHNLALMMSRTLSQAGQIPMEQANAALSFLMDQLYYLAVVVLPVSVAIMIGGVCSNYFQVGPMFTTKVLEIKLNKINPITGFGRLFSKKSLVELFKSIGKLTLVAVIAYLVIASEMEQVLLLVDMEPANIGLYVLGVSLKLFLFIITAFLILAVLDFIVQRQLFMENMKMTKEEVKDEHKQLEGDPKVKSKIRSLQLEAARKRMMASVPNADVVVTNPTHVAVALQYDQETAQAPMVVAKGRALLAEKIKEIAKENNVPIMEEAPLARALFKAVEVGQTIPFMFYQAVAEVLAYVYRMKGKQVRGRSRS